MKTKYKYSADHCFTFIPEYGVVAKIVVGVSGYYPVPSDAVSGNPQAYVEAENAKLGVSKAEAEAILVGSMFGWNVPGADPSNALHKNL